MKKRIEKTLRKVNAEMKDSNTIKVNTITNFTTKSALTKRLHKVKSEVPPKPTT